MIRSVVFTLLSLLCTGLWGQIQVPAKILPGQPIPATIAMNIPRDAKVEGPGWQVPVGVGIHRFSDTAIGLWPSQPGTYQIAYEIFWIHVQNVTVLGEDGKPVEIPVYRGHGWVRETAEFVYGEATPPPPPPPPPPVSQLGVVVIEDVEARTALPYGQIQAMGLADIRQLPKVFRLLDKDVRGADGKVPPALAPWLALATSYPYLIVFDVPTGNVVWKGVLPSSADEMRALIRKYLPAPAKLSRAPCPQGVCP